MHRQRTRLAARVPGRAQPVAKAVEKTGIVATYQLHDRLLSNRASRRQYADSPPALNDVQRRIVEAVVREGYTTLRFDELVSDDALRDAVLEQGASFVADTERGLREESQDESGSSELRRRPGKEFLVRAHSFDGVRLGLDHAWLRASLSPHMLAVANAYLRMWAKLSYVDLWYTVPQPVEAERVASQLWHYDFDDKHLLKAFLYLDDVDKETGPFEYVAGSQPGGPHHDVRPWRPMGYGRVPEADVQRSVPDEAIRTFAAPRGTIIFCNTSGLHRGGFATARARVLATATYCSPASLAALSQRNYDVDPSQLSDLSREGRYAVS
jgi:hypothetical protein